MSNSDYVSQKLAQVESRIKAACTAIQRPYDEVQLIGASKKQAADLMLEFHRSGLINFGENYLQEALDKQQDLAISTIKWHFIGHIQSNKSKLIANHFDWVHGVDRLKIAKRLAAQNERETPLKMLIQLNPDKEASKSGISIEDAPILCQQIADIDGADLRGFMMIPKSRQEPDQQRAVFAQARELLEMVNQNYGLNLDQLSMGMSGDLEAAIAEGSTMVRIGTDLFGKRL